ncbi:Recombination endonuclease VII [Popillia japonica]|uniref:Recombination endonuclease VII n=1 Tax=Popillia japonica TaxID=7064 RepID=A0AAW1HVE7_POPJA
MKPLTDEESISYEQATVCHICEKAIQSYEEKVRDHDHMTGFYRGAAHMYTSALRQPTGVAQRVSSYPHYDTVADFTDLTFPTNLKDIVRFEEKNDISINVYGIEEYFNGAITIQPFTVKCFEHVPYSFAYYVKCCFNDSLNKLRVVEYRGENASDTFIRELESDIKFLYENYLILSFYMRII